MNSTVKLLNQAAEKYGEKLHMKMSGKVLVLWNLKKKQ